MVRVGAGKKYNNADMLAMAAESFMNLHPWDYYMEVWIPTLDSYDQFPFHLISKAYTHPLPTGSGHHDI